MEERTVFSLNKTFMNIQLSLSTGGNRKDTEEKKSADFCRIQSPLPLPFLFLIA